MAGNSFLVKKVSFRVGLLPVIKILSALLIHVFFVLIVLIINWFYGYPPTIYSLQLFYYLFGLLLLLLGLTWFTSSIFIFFKDTSQFISIAISLGFWITPVFWSLGMVPDKYKFLFELNPMVYIVEGYRSSFIYHQWFWESPLNMVAFWLEVISVFFIGVFVFKRLRPQFADVL
ncbi:hypothetical protein BN871_EX_00040 [Paenibacillus sp. P22]|nr:hypothetical protein BN871_EX_00040 [Paenibacillus sp. P22]